MSWDAIATWSALIAGLTGFAVGSFLNVCIDRLPVGRSIVTVPSHCEVCGHRLKVLDLVPVISYLWLRGKCRYCSARIPKRIPVVEMATGVIFAFVVYKYGLSTVSLAVMAYASVLIVILVIDLEHQLILNAITYPSMVVALLVTPWGPLGEGVSIRLAYQDALLGFLLGGSVLLLVFVIARGGFGAGDVKLGALLGIMLGFVPTLITLEMSFIAGGIVAILLILLKIRRRKDQVPFGPFLAGSGVISLFWGQVVSNWYQNLLAVSSISRARAMAFVCSFRDPGVLRDAARHSLAISCALSILSAWRLSGLLPGSSTPVDEHARPAGSSSSDQMCQRRRMTNGNLPMVRTRGRLSGS